MTWQQWESQRWENSYAHLYCGKCGERFTIARPDIFGWLLCIDCGMYWRNRDAFEQFDIASAELTDWETFNFFGELNL